MEGFRSYFESSAFVGLMAFSPSFAICHSLLFNGTMGHESRIDYCLYTS